MTRRPIPHDLLEMLDAIERRGSFAKAAEELGRATSAMSYGVQKLEEQLGITIFERRGRRSELTPAGRLLLTEGRRILSATEELAERARELASGWETRIRIGIEATLNPEKAFEAIAEFQHAHPSIEIDVSETLLNGSWESLEQKRIDLLIGAVAPVPSHRGFRTVGIGPADLVAVIGHAHPGASEAGTLEGVRRVAVHDTVTSDVPRSEGLELVGHPTCYVQTMEQKRLAIIAGLGAGYLPRHRIQSELSSGALIALESRADVPEQYIAWMLSNKGKGLAALVQLLEQVTW